VHRLLHTFEVIQTTNSSHDISGIGALLAPRLDPAALFTRVQERVEHELSAVMGEQALPKIMQEREVESWVSQLQTQGVLPVHAAAHGIGRLAVSKPFHILHDGRHGQAPRRNLHGMSTVGIAIGEQIVAIN
jgi:hypothetical protein